MTPYPHVQDFITPVKFHVGENDILTIDDVDWRLDAEYNSGETAELGYMFRAVSDAKLVMRLKHAELTCIIDSGKYRYYENGLDVAQQRASLLAGIQTNAKTILAELPQRKRKRIYFTYVYAISFLSDERAGFYKRTEDNLKRSIVSTHEHLQRTQTSGDWQVPPPPSTRTL